MKFKLIVGLGNPSTEHSGTWHNVGFLYIDHLRRGARMKKTEKQFEYAARAPFVLIKPTTWMNESGKAVAAALRYFKTKPDTMLVVHDDADILLGNYRLQFGRGAAGHRGVASIISHLGNHNFWRARIGIRKKPGAADGQMHSLRKRSPASALVLKKIHETDKPSLYGVFEEVANATLNCIENDSP